VRNFIIAKKTFVLVKHSHLLLEEFKTLSEHKESNESNYFYEKTSHETVPLKNNHSNEKTVLCKIQGVQGIKS
jgi:hypothetical protein